MPNSLINISTVFKETTEGWHLLVFMRVKNKGVLTGLPEQLDSFMVSILCNHKLHVLIAVVLTFGLCILDCELIWRMP